MSMHTFTTVVTPNSRYDQTEATTTAGQPAALRCGWDRRLREFFLNIRIGQGEEQETVYDTLMDGGISDAQDIQAYCEYYGLELPANFISTLQAEQAANTGNKVTEWTLTGGQVLFEDVTR